MNQPAWLTKYKKEKPPVPQQITRLGMQTPMRQLPGGYNYTGAGFDGAVQSNRPVMMDTLAVHEGETITPAQKTAAAGGPDMVKNAVDQQIMMRKQNMPNVVRADVGMPVATKQKVVNPGFSIQTTDPSQGLNVPPVLPGAGQDATLSTGQSATGISAVNAQSKRPVPVLPGSAQDATLSTGQASAAGQAAQTKPAPAVTPTSATSGDKTLSDLANYNNAMKGSLQQTQQLAAGTSPMYNRLANQAQNQLNQNLATQDLGNKLGMAQNPNLTSGMQNTMQAMSQQNAGVQQSNLAANLAQNATQMAATANQQAFTQGQQMYQQQMDKVNTVLSTALQSGDIDTYASTFKKAYGIDVDTTALKDEATRTQFSNAMADANKTLVQYPNATLDTGALKLDAQAAWRAQGNTGPMNDKFAQQWLDTLKVTQTPWYQATHDMSQTQAYEEFGKTYVDGYTDKVTGKTGYDGFNIAFAREMVNGGFTLAASGNITFSKNLGDIISSIQANNTTPAGTTAQIGTTAGGTPIMAAGGQEATGGQTDPTTAASWKTGQTVTLGNNQFVVGGVNSTGDKVLVDAKGNLYDSTGAAITDSQAIKDIGVYQGKGGAAYYDGKQITPVGGTGTVKLDPAGATDPTTDDLKATDAKGNAVLVDKTTGNAYYPGLSPFQAGKAMTASGEPVTDTATGNAISGYAQTASGNIGTDGKGNYYTVGTNGTPAAYTYANYDKDSANLTTPQKNDLLKSIVSNTTTSDADKTKAYGQLFKTNSAVGFGQWYKTTFDYFSEPVKSFAGAAKHETAISPANLATMNSEAEKLLVNALKQAGLTDDQITTAKGLFPDAKTLAGIS